MFESLGRAWGRKQEPEPKAPKLGVAGEGGGRAEPSPGTPAPHCSRNWVPRVPLLPQGMARPASQLPERSALPGRRVPPPAPVRPDSQGLGLVLTNEPVSAAPGRFAGFRAPRPPSGLSWARGVTPHSHPMSAFPAGSQSSPPSSPLTQTRSCVYHSSLSSLRNRRLPEDKGCIGSSPHGRFLGSRLEDARSLTKGIMSKA